jgi:hypothetical protein
MKFSKAIFVKKQTIKPTIIIKEVKINLLRLFILQGIYSLKLSFMHLQKSIKSVKINLMHTETCL